MLHIHYKLEMKGKQAGIQNLSRNPTGGTVHMPSVFETPTRNDSLPIRQCPHYCEPEVPRYPPVVKSPQRPIESPLGKASGATREECSKGE